jgi:aminoglycoside phosphotransferase (APT) family kinase protein
VTEQLLGAKLAEGACAEIYAWGAGDSKVVKLAKPNTNLFALERELRHCHIAWRLGLSVPQPYDLVQANGRHGIVFARATGDTLLQKFAGYALSTASRPVPDAGPDYLEARTTARTLHLIHSKTSDDLPGQRASLERDIRRTDHLTDGEKDAVIGLLEALPHKRQLCHGDPNPGNFLLTEGGVVIVDWNNATLGNPEADLAEYVLMLRHARLPHGAPPEVVGLFEATREHSIRLFTTEYQSLTGIGEAEIDPWLGPIAARKLAADAITETERDALVSEVRQRLRQAGPDLPETR